MVYNWQDLRDRHLEVEWGEDDIRRTRRTRALAGGYGPHVNQKSNWTSVIMVVVSTIGAIGIATLVALTLVKAPIQRRPPGGTAKMAEGVDLSITAELPPTLSPSHESSSNPTLPPTWIELETDNPSMRPTTFIPETDSPSKKPTTTSPTEMPSEILKAPPAPEESSIFAQFFPKVSPAPPAPQVTCYDKPGVYYNHAGDKVSCDWFETVGTYNFHKNCDKTDLGHACLLSCREWNNCVLATNSPSKSPTSAPSTVEPTSNPTPEPPKSLTLQASGDATIKQEEPSATLGSSSWLKVEVPLPDDDLSIAERISRMQNGEPGEYHALLRFDINEHDSSRPIKSSSLRLKAANNCSSGGYLQHTSSPHWEEDTITWQSAPQGDGVEIGRLGNIVKGFWYSIDMSEILAKHLPAAGDKTLSLRLFPVAYDECLYVSKDNNSGGGPELHIEYADV